MSLHTWHCQGPRKPSSCTTFMLSSHWGRAATGRKKVLCLCMRGCFGLVQLFMTLWTVACQAFLPGGFSRQEYWSVLANTGCYTLLEHCISCCPSCQHPEYLVPPEPLQPKQLHDLQIWPSGANPSPPRQPQEQTPVDDPYPEVEIETQGQCG